MPQQTSVVGRKSEVSGTSDAVFDAVWSVGEVESNVRHRGGGEYVYAGEGDNEEEDIGSLRTSRPLSLAEGGVSSFEVTLLDTGDQNFIAIGVCHSGYPTSLLPGWEPTSAGFHMDEGGVFNSSEDPVLNVEPGKVGDVVKCSLLPCPGSTENVRVEFCRNGVKIVEVVTPTTPTGLHGCIGMMSKGESIRLSPPQTATRLDFIRLWEVTSPGLVSPLGGGVCSYIGRGDFREDSIGTVRSKEAIRLFGAEYERSFEIEILDTGAKGYIGMGVCSVAYPKNLLPGWQGISAGYHADNGQLFNSSSKGVSTNHPCQRGDVMRCCVEPLDVTLKQVKVSFSKNGELVGSFMFWTPDGGLYFCFGMMSCEEKVRVNLAEIVRAYIPPTMRFHEVWAFPNGNFLYRENGICVYSGIGGNHNVGTIRSTRHIDPFSSNNYFEVKIIDPGAQCYIALGVCAASYPPNLPPGWKEVSVGFNAESGLILQSFGGEMQTNHPCCRGDVLRCSLEAVDGAAKQVIVKFFKNGEFAGQMFLWVPSEGLHALVSCLSPGEVIQLACPEMEPSVLLPGPIPVQHPDARTREPDPVAGKAESPIPGVQPPQHHTKSDTEAGASFVPEPGTGFVPSGHDPLRKVQSETGISKQNPQERSTTRSLSASAGQPALRGMMHPHREPPPGMGLHSFPGYGYQSPAPHSRHPHPGYYPVFSHGGYPPHMLPPHLRPFYHHHTAYNPYGLYPSPTGSPMPDRRYPYAGSGMSPEPRSVSPVSFQSQPPWLQGSPYPSSSFHPFHQPHTSLPPSSLPPSSLPPSSLPPSSLPPSSFPVTTLPSGPFRSGGLPQQTAAPPPMGHVPKSLHLNPEHIYASQVSTASSASDSDAQHDPGTGYEGDIVSRGSSSHDLKASAATKAASLPMAKDLLSSPLHSSVASEGGGYVREDAGKGGGAAEGASAVASPSVPRPSSSRAVSTKDFSKREEKVRFSGYEFSGGASKAPVSLEDVQGGKFVQEPVPSAVRISDTVESIPPIKSGDAIDAKTVDPQPKPPAPFVPSVPLNISPRVLPKQENKTYQVLDNVELSDGGSISSTVRPHTAGLSLVKFRLPVSEKLPYFEVTLDRIDSDANTAIGLTAKIYPAYSPPPLPGDTHMSVACHSSSGMLRVGGAEERPLTSSLESGDVVGCKVHLVYKSEVVDPQDDDAGKVKVEFFRNGVSNGSVFVRLPVDGFYPTIAFYGCGTRLTPRYDITLRPEKYFDSHPIPDNYRNFSPPPPVREVWNCAVNSKVEDGKYIVVGDTTQSRPAVVQSSFAFTEMMPYFEIELLCPITAYSTLSLGAVPKITGNSKQITPGEAPNSVGFIPLLGFLMRNNVICSSVPEEIAYAEKTRIGIGIDFNRPIVSLAPLPPSSPATTKTSLSSASPSSSTALLRTPSSTPSASPSDIVSIFFTVNGQQVSAIRTSLPSGGFFPTVAVDPDRWARKERLVELDFSKVVPRLEGLPSCFVRGDVSQFYPFGLMGVVDMEGRESKQKGTAVRMFQAAFPLSQRRSYFEVCIVDGGENYCISCGLASFNYPINVHPGWQKNSIAFHADDGHLFYNSDYHMVAPACQYDGAVMGCGARFPPDGSSQLAEVFFTVNRVMVARKLIPVPQVGFFPTIGMRTLGAVVSINLQAPDPFADLQFSSAWSVHDNVRVDGGSYLHLQNMAKPGFAQLARPALPDKVTYFTVLSTSAKSGSISIGFSSPGLSPFSHHSVFDGGLASYGLEVLTGGIYLKDRHFKTKHTCPVEGGMQFGCGLLPLRAEGGYQLENSRPTSDALSLLFFTVDDQVVFCIEVNLCECKEPLRPYIIVLETKAKLSVNPVAMWPPGGPLGTGWARHAHLMMKDSTIRQLPISRQSKRSLAVGYAIAAMPLVPSSPYFEVEVCSRDPTSRITIGLAGRDYRGDKIVGFKERTIGYNLSDGKVYKGHQSWGQQVGMKVDAGHTIGCGYKWRHNSEQKVGKVDAGHTVGCAIRSTSLQHSTAVSHVRGNLVEVFFTLDNAIIATEKFQVLPGGLFPTICLDSPLDSVIFHRRNEFPPVENRVGHEWQNAYGVRQCGAVIEYDCPHQGIKRAFCQASEPVSSRRSYFEIEIVGCNELSQISAGISPAIPRGSVASQTFDSILYHSSGFVLLRKGLLKETASSQKCCLGDQLGCAIIYLHEQPVTIEFYLNNLKVMAKEIAGQWNDMQLYPTFVLSLPGDAIFPKLCLPLPTWSRDSVVGWLRSERVRLRNNIVEYAGSGTKTMNVGVAQSSQCLELGASPYFEVEVLDRGEKGTISMGVAPADYPMDVQAGWKDNSIGYHCDDGCLFHANGYGCAFGPAWKRHDVIGMGIRAPDLQEESASPPSEVQAFFARNGEEIGHTTILIPHSGLFPMVGLHSPRETVKVTVHKSIPSNSGRASKSWRTICGLKVSLSPVDGNEASFTLAYWKNGRGTHRGGVRTALAVGARSFSETMQYFEVEVRAMGKLMGIAVGVAPKQYSVEEMPGWDTGSVAYHTDNGELYYYSGRGKVFGPVARRGDVIGCGVSFIPNDVKHCSIFFTYNGCEIGRQRAVIPDGGLFPAVGLSSKGDEVRVRFKNTFKPRVSQSEVHFVGLMRIHNCSYSNQIVQFTGGGNSGVSSAPAMAQFAIPLHRNCNYFSANIVRCKDAILIGLAVRDYPMKYAPGYTSVSVAYDALKGCVRAVFSSDNTHMFDDVPKCAVGDTVGCGIDTETSDPKEERAFVFFTRNGIVVKRMELMEVFEDLYPIVGMVPKGRQSAVFMDWNTPVFEQPNVF